MRILLLCGQSMNRHKFCILNEHEISANSTQTLYGMPCTVEMQIIIFLSVCLFVF